MATHLEAGGYVFKTPAGVSSLQDVYAREHDTRRLERIGMSWRFYYGQHWTFEREDDEPLVTTNYYRKFIDKKVEFLIGSDFTLNVPKSLESLTLPKLLSVWQDNKRQALNYEIGQEGAVTGDVFLLVTVDEADAQAVRFDPYTKHRIVIQRLSSHQCFPVWDETKPTGRYGRPMKAFTLVRWIKRWNATRQEDEEVRYVMTITPSQIIEKIGEENAKVEPNVLGEIPVVHIPNYPTSGSMFGVDDGADLIPLNREHNEKSTDISDSINYNSSPVTVITGAKGKDLHRSPRAVWSIPQPDAKVEILKLEGDLDAAVSYLERNKESMHDVGGVPQSAFGNVKNLSGTSGVALAMTLQPLIDERNRKRATYEPGYERVNYFILRYAEEFHGLRLPEGLCEKCGGKIAIFYVPDPDTAELSDDDPDKREDIQVRRCFQVDPDTLNFLDPTKKTVPTKPVMADPPVKVDGVTLPNVPEAARGKYGEEEPNIPEEFDLPLVTHVEVDLEGKEIPGTMRTIQFERKGITAIPIDCDSHSYLNPFTSYVIFNDTFPKDKKEQMDLLAQMLALKLITRAYAMAQVGVENIDDMLKAVEAEKEKDFQQDMRLNLALNGIDAANEEAQGIERDELGNKKPGRGRPKNPAQKPKAGPPPQ